MIDEELILDEQVALRKESVDRNLEKVISNAYIDSVALRKESVDRNTQRRDFKALGLPVALRKESVDRNIVSILSIMTALLSLSARRAWIEMPVALSVSLAACVALRKESVDRNA